MYKDQMNRVADVTVQWLTGQLSDVEAIDRIQSIVLSHIPDDTDLEVHVGMIWDNEPFDQVTLLVEGM